MRKNVFTIGYMPETKPLVGRERGETLWFHGAIVASGEIGLLQSSARVLRPGKHDLWVGFNFHKVEYVENHWILNRVLPMDLGREPRG